MDALIPIAILIVAAILWSRVERAIDESERDDERRRFFRGEL